MDQIAICRKLLSKAKGAAGAAIRSRRFFHADRMYSESPAFVARPLWPPSADQRVSLPFRQLEQFPPAEIHRRLVELSVHMPHVHARQSRVASPHCVALCVDDAVSWGRWARSSTGTSSVTCIRRRRDAFT